MNVNSLSLFWKCRHILDFGLETNIFIVRYKYDPKAREKLVARIRTLPVIKSTRLKSTAGKACISSHHETPHIKLHAALFDDKDYVAEDKQDTFFHEISHFIAYWAANERGHGNAWRYTMQHFGFDPMRCVDPKYSYRGYKNRAENREVDTVINDFLEDF